jgi:hypothetical protein
MDMKLTKLRNYWEHNLTVKLAIRAIGNELLVILQSGCSGGYHVHRYFPLENRWEISIDYSGPSLENAIERVNSWFADDVKVLMEREK